MDQQKTLQEKQEAVEDNYEAGYFFNMLSGAVDKLKVRVNHVLHPNWESVRERARFLGFKLTSPIVGVFRPNGFSREKENVSQYSGSHGLDRSAIGELMENRGEEIKNWVRMYIFKLLSKKPKRDEDA